MYFKISEFLKTHFFSLLGTLKLKTRVTAYGLFYVNDSRKIKIGKCCRINRGVFLLTRNDIQIGDNVVLSADVMVLDSGLDVEAFQNGNVSVHTNSFVKIEDNVWVGARAILLPGVTIGHHSIVAAGSVVTKSVPPHTLVAGNPAKKIRDLAAPKDSR